MKFALILVLAAFASAEASQSWNSLLKTNIFPENLDAVRSTASVEELKTLLSQSGVFNEIYGNYVNQFNKAAIRSKDIVHHQVFRTKLITIAEHNIEAQAGKHSWQRAVNQFTDMTEEEITAEYTGYQVQLSSALANSTLPITAPRQYSPITRAPDSVYWGQYISAVKDQGGCGSCVPFAATACLESSHALWHNGQILDLSEQELVDCSKGNGNNGCAGGTFVPTFDYLRNNGLTTEGEYPYEGRDGSCRSGGKSKPARVSGWWPVEPHGDENALKEAVSLYGPIAVAIHANDAFMGYGGGVFEAQCQGGRNHAVLVVGYGNEGGRDYWLAKNSWNTWWGESGFVKIRRNYGNVCDVAGDAVLINA